VSSARPTNRPGGPDQVPTLPGRFRAVVFDLDGLLLDTEPGWHHAEAELLRRHGATYTDADETATLGWSVEATVARYAERLGLRDEAVPSLSAELLELAQREYSRNIAPRPGAADLVARLWGRVPLGIASNTPRSLVLSALESTGLADAFDAIVSGEEVAHPKPAPDVYLETCRQLNVHPSTAIGLEDSAFGISAAKAAGLTVIAVPQWAVVDVSAADFVAASLEELLVRSPRD
jgi:HAD superfamily hydrolase (TIGR01509 family)